MDVSIGIESNMMIRFGLLVFGINSICVFQNVVDWLNKEETLESALMQRKN